ncbi:hypothetical protein GIB67_006567 [Kingdonia uniflora]|uniref:Uncharacterized protein n=1 Tax=Kingdonia uniflora TaxID=39325 RepID=A0A7J7LEX8_9MAGN|nr:hypothetical protein GIB67_006567 [Kingdonia uniflora]
MKHGDEVDEEYSEGSVSLTADIFPRYAQHYPILVVSFFAPWCYWSNRLVLCGVDRAMINHFDAIRDALIFSAVLRALNAQVGETSRLAWLGVEVDPLAQSEDMLKKAYNRQSKTVSSQPSSNWFISKNAVVSGLGLLGFNEGDTNQEDGAPPKA